MPFTPFHFGLGIAVKAAIPRRFSFSVFCFAQIVTDSEVLVYMARGSSQLHGFFHTFVGAGVVGLFSVIAGRPLCRSFLRWWSANPNLPLKDYYNGSPEIRIGPAITGAFVGSMTHVLLDSFMHADVRPMSPWTNQNPLFGYVGPGAIHLICFVLGVVGALICARLPNAKL
jgi:hypothetical protein